MDFSFLNFTAVFRKKSTVIISKSFANTLLLEVVAFDGNDIIEHWLLDPLEIADIKIQKYQIIFKISNLRKKH